MDCAKEKLPGKYLISDGGITTPGDVAKALVFADMVMVRKHVSRYRRDSRLSSRAFSELLIRTMKEALPINKIEWRE
jgi:hypothetical protein